MFSTGLRLDPADEFCHPIEAASSFNESMYVNVMAGVHGLGAWVRVGNRPNEGHAEVSCCVYLPDGRVGFFFGRPESRTNNALMAGGAAFEVAVPFEQLRVSYVGPLCVLAEPRDMMDPKRALASSPIVDCRLELTLDGLVRPFGGEPRDPQVDIPLSSFARGHYEQHVRGRGVIEVAGESYHVDGLGLRDHSWGPRYWQNVSWYRFLPMAFSAEFALSAVLVGEDEGTLHAGGMVLRRGANGALGYIPVDGVAITSEYDPDEMAIAQTMVVTTAERSYHITGTALALIPLRNRRDGQVTRITEAMTRFECDGLVGYGMSEYLDQVIDGQPSGRHC
jgi:hypothetical protein